MQYNFREIEAKWQAYWSEKQTFAAHNKSDLPKFYVLDMFPYPSGAGLHVGHPLGYIASDIYARYKRHKGFNVLHPQGYDSFGLPAEQYAIQTGQHPAITTQTNINTYRRQLDQLGFSFDWSREVRTSDPSYYKWTQWIFSELYDSWYDTTANKARPITALVAILETEGNHQVHAVCDENTPIFSAADWKLYTPKKQQQILLHYRLTYLAETEVNWCPALGTVLANDEIINGLSERGSHPVVRKKMTQWSMRITAYAQRLLDDLATIDWPQPLKDSQTNWIGRSEGAMVRFFIPSPALPIRKGDIAAFAEAKDGAMHHDDAFAEAKDGKDYLHSHDRSRGYMTGGKHSHLLLEKAKEMRMNPTEAEAALWQQLKGKKLGHKFRQQHLIDNFIVDFVCLWSNLIVEVDGDYHLDPEVADKDRERQNILEDLGYTVLRFTNKQVLQNIDSVLLEIQEMLNTLPSDKQTAEGKTAGEAKNKELAEEKVLPPGKDSGWEIEVFTTRPDTIFGVSFMTLAPELELVQQITTPEQREEVDAYIQATALRSERDRMADVKTISGAFTGAYALHPFTGKKVPIYIGDYVLAGYGTGAVMAVPCGDQRDYDFAKHFGINIPNIFEGVDISQEAFADKDNTKITNSDFLNGLSYKKAMKRVIYELEQQNLGYGKVNYRLRDAVFSRQRYWGEPFPVYYVDGMPQIIAAQHLPVRLPEVEKYLPTETGEPPLGNATHWAWCTTTNQVVANNKIDQQTVFPLELNTMPGWAGSSWYFNRYMDANNTNAFASKEAIDYWQDVDLYIGGSEHATGHLLYSRFWQKFLFDRGHVPVQEYAKKLINQGMITGTSAFVYRVEGENKVVSKGLIGNQQVQPIHANVAMVNASDELDIEAFKQWRPEYAHAEWVLEDGKYIVGREVEKMSKSKYNVVNPDHICQEYGADSLRLYEMFLGPLEQSKPWNTAGITGVHSFLKKLWKLYIGENGLKVTDSQPTKDNLKTLHKTIKKVAEDIENFSFNTSVSTFMIAVNELTAQKCSSKAVLQELIVLISPYAPHISEELWAQLGNNTSIATAAFPLFDASHLVESSKEYPISFNGKLRFKLELPLDLSKEEIEKAVLAHEKTQAQLQGRTPKKVIVVPGKIVNVVG